MLDQFATLMGVFRYEFRMQARRPLVWIAMLLIALMQLGLMLQIPFVTRVLFHLPGYPLLHIISLWTGYLNWFLPIGIGVLLADRLPRDRRTKVEELFLSTPSALSARLLGKYLGSMSATCLPLLLVYGLGIAFVLSQTHNLLVLPLALLTFVTIMLPGILFISAFSIACPSFLWVPLYQFLFVCYWFWGNLLGPNAGIPTLSSTILTPIGIYIVEGFYQTQLYGITSSPQLASASIAVLIGFSAFALYALWGLLRWQQAHQ